MIHPTTLVVHLYIVVNKIEIHHTKSVVLTNGYRASLRYAKSGPCLPASHLHLFAHRSKYKQNSQIQGWLWVSNSSTMAWNTINSPSEKASFKRGRIGLDLRWELCSKSNYRIAGSILQIGIAPVHRFQYQFKNVHTHCLIPFGVKF